MKQDFFRLPLMQTSSPSIELITSNCSEYSIQSNLRVIAIDGFRSSFVSGKKKRNPQQLKVRSYRNIRNPRQEADTLIQPTFHILAANRHSLVIQAATVLFQRGDMLACPERKRERD